MKLMVQKAWNNALLPADPHSEAIVDKLPVGESLLVTMQRARNPQFHRKAMAVVRTAFENQDAYASFDAFLAAVKALAGPFKRVEIKAGPETEIKFIAGSISFSEMSEDEFSQWYSDALAAMERLTGIPAYVLDQNTI